MSIRIFSLQMTDITLPSRYLVFMPENSHVGVSQRIESEEERARLKALVEPYCDELGGYIIRTAAEGVSEEELKQDADFLKRLWRKVMERKAKYESGLGGLSGRGHHHGALLG